MWTDQVNRSNLRLLLLIGVLAVLPLASERAFAQFLSHDHPLSDGEIKIGMSNAQTGRIGVLGLQIRQGCMAYFTRVNQAGGVAGRRLVLVDYDDRYEPVETVSNTERLIDQDKVFALLNFHRYADVPGHPSDGERGHIWSWLARFPVQQSSDNRCSA